MTWIRIFIHRLCGLFLKRKLDQELEDEIRAHLDMQFEDNLRRIKNFGEKRGHGKTMGIDWIDGPYRVIELSQY